MYGAIIGDIAGSIYEYDEYNDTQKGFINLKRRLEILTKKELITDDCFYSDDTILTIAILDAILNKKDYKSKLKEYGIKYGIKPLNRKHYFEYMFSPSFTKWCEENSVGTSIGNGCMMRVSPVGFLFNSIEEVKKNAELATIPSHNNPKSIRAAQIISTVIFLARTGKTKEQIREYLQSEYDLNFEYKLEELQRINMFDVTVGVLEKCIYILLISNNFEDSIRKAISIGGDTDTIACIVGGMAEALYGVPKELIKKVNNILPKEFIEILKQYYN